MSVSENHVAAVRSPSQAVTALRSLAIHPMGIIGATILLLVGLAAVFAPMITTVGPAEIDYSAILQPPSAEYVFGTDEIGRSVYSRTVYGARIAFFIVVISVGLSLMVGTLIGLVSGYFGGRTDIVAMRVMDAVLAFPTLVLALAIVAILGPSLINALVAIAVVSIPSFARLARGSVLVVRELDYVRAAQVLGASRARIMFLHIAPNIMPNVIVFASLTASSALITESGLSFLGLGVQPPTPSWGYMVAIGMNYWTSWWLSFFPGLAIFLTVLGFNLFGDALRDVLDPRHTS
ncbi:ABC transporter permease [Oricola indica]|jgi:peptide/nickel transport system permease protein|uniref:ABC transporter permease n=1 Tax=Oricola indica TaxID=2872591 RepID=UPI001CBF5FD9|nr:ABC transporter permease [Oricola indica]